MTETHKETMVSEPLPELDKLQKATDTDRLIESSSRFKQILDHIDDVLWMSDPHENNMLFISAAYEKIWGKPADAVYADPKVWIEDIHPEDREAMIKDFSELALKGKEYYKEYRIIRPDGTIRWVADSAFPVFDKKGNFHRIAGSVQDITERVLTMEQVFVLQRRQELILNSAGEGICEIDTQGQIRYVNISAEKLIGLPRHELYGMSEHELLHHSHEDGTHFPEEKCPIHATLKGEQIYHVVDEVFWKADGSSFAVEYVCTPIKDDEGSVTGAVLIFRDISARKKLETELLLAQKLESVGQLAAGIAHEINTPAQYVGDNLRFLNDAFKDITRLINSYQQLAQDCSQQNTFTEKITEINALTEEIDLEYVLEEFPLALNQSIDGIESVSTIVRAMKEFSHPGSEDMEMGDINHIIENTATVSKSEWKYVSDIKFELDESIPKIMCHVQTIGQVILNLIVNAAHAITDANKDNPQQRGTITISTKNIDQHIELKIKDTGAGIPEGIRKKIFDPFFTTKGVGKGTGQGLAIAHSTLVDKHKGEIKCESEVGVGTTFILRLPIEQTSQLNTE